jgi:hypothetical protein
MAREPFPTTTASSEGGSLFLGLLLRPPFGSFTNETYFGRTDGSAHRTGRADRAPRNQRDCGLDIHQSNLGERPKRTGRLNPHARRGVDSDSSALRTFVLVQDSAL